MQTLGKSYKCLDCKVWDFPSLFLFPQFKMWPPTCCCPFSFIFGGRSFMPWHGICVWRCCVRAFQWQLRHWARFICFRKKKCVWRLLKSPHSSRLTCPVQGVQHTLSDGWDRPLLPSAWSPTSFHGSWHLHSSSAPLKSPGTIFAFEPLSSLPGAQCILLRRSCVEQVPAKHLPKNLCSSMV